VFHALLYARHTLCKLIDTRLLANRVAIGIRCIATQPRLTHFQARKSNFYLTKCVLDSRQALSLDAKELEH